MRRPAGIPTLYNGVQYRSRLEARWANFFDALGWEFQYEPFDLDGWIPDFLLLRFRALVEIKPVVGFPEAIADEIDRALDGSDEWQPLILGCTVPADAGFWGCLSSGGTTHPVRQHQNIPAAAGVPFGWLRADPPSWRPEIGKSWGTALMRMHHDAVALKLRQGGDLSWPYTQEWALQHSLGPVMRADPGCTVPDLADALIHGKYAHFHTHCDAMKQTSEMAEMLVGLWNRAGNLTQWKGRRSIVS